MNLEKNGVYTLRIEGCSSEGLGVARAEGRVVFVKDALPGEVCDVLIMKVKAGVAWGKAIRHSTLSPERIEPECPYFGKCGGCDFLHCTYKEELRLKKLRIEDAISRIGGVDLRLSEIRGAPERFGYRNKAVYSVAEKDGRAITGFYRDRSHEVVPIDRCLLQHESADLCAASLREWMDTYGIAPYDEKSRTGLIRRLFVRTVSDGNVGVCIVSAGMPPHTDKLVTLIAGAVPKIVSVTLDLNSSDGNKVLSGNFKTLFGDTRIHETLRGLRFSLSPESFFQINVRQADVLYGIAQELSNLNGNEHVLDLYSGTGTIGLLAARYARHVTCVEIVKAAVDDARENAIRNAVTNVGFICADASEAARKLTDSGTLPDVIIVDPPRKGLLPGAVETISSMSPDRIVYVSCDPATLARDLKKFHTLGYSPKILRAVDMFPATMHVETVVLITRVDK